MVFISREIVLRYKPKQYLIYLLSIVLVATVALITIFVMDKPLERVFAGALTLILIVGDALMLMSTVKKLTFLDDALILKTVGFGEKIIHREDIISIDANHLLTSKSRIDLSKVINTEEVVNELMKLFEIKNPEDGIKAFRMGGIAFNREQAELYNRRVMRFVKILIYPAIIFIIIQAVLLINRILLIFGIDLLSLFRIG